MPLASELGPFVSPRSVSLPELVRWGEQVGRDIVPPRVLAISGELGSGKTTLIQAICKGFGVVEHVTSPTFSLVHEYHAPKGAVYHLDLYRLRDPGELTNIGWDDVVHADALVCVEWPERAGDRLPPDAARIHLAYASVDSQRLIVVRSTC